MTTAVRRKTGDFWVDYVRPLFDGTFAREWFTWMEWLLVTAAVYAAGVAAKNVIVMFLGFASALLAFFYVAQKIEGLAKEASTAARRVRRLWLRTLAITIVLAVQIVIFLAIYSTVQTLVHLP